MAGEALGLLGLCRAQRCNFVKGAGANSRSMLSDLRANLLGDQHQFVSPSVFEIDEEFRKQACGFAFARAITIQEAVHSTKIKSDIFKKLISGEVLPARYNYGRETLYLSWRNRAFYWELNSDVPRVLVQKKRMMRANGGCI